MVLSNEKLPMKSLNRFKCVHTSWAILFKNTYFMDMYRKSFISNNSFYDDTCLLLKQTLLDFENHSLLYLFPDEGFDNKVKIDWPPPIQEDDCDINILGSGINGIICLYAECISSKIVLWNPAIQEFKVIPSNHVPPYVSIVDQLHGFGYDYVRDDYNVIRFAEFYVDHNYYLNPHLNKALSKVVYDPSWEMYSLKSNFWEKLDLDMTNPYLSCPGVLEQVYVNGVCHWLGGNERDIDSLYLVSFDLGNKVFFLTPAPSIVDDEINNVESVSTYLLLLNESVSLISYYAWENNFHVSVLGEIGVKESWNKLFIVGPLPYIGRPIGVGKNCDILLALEDEELARCDLNTRTIQKLGINRMFFSCQILTRKGQVYVRDIACEESFVELKKLRTSLVLVLNNPSELLVVYCEASKTVLGCVLMQNCQVVAYASKQLKKSKIEHQNPLEMLQSLHTPEWKWDNIFMDCVSGLPKTTKDNHSMQKLAEMYIEGIVRLHGIVSIILSNRDLRYTSRFWKSFQGTLGTKLRLSYAYHLEMDCQTERIIKCLEDLLRICVLEQGVLGTSTCN
ncbi:F-box/kelch-repeat protein At3g23880-like [Vicia villosa]|uniref:F-box/kelch-repeat protein At3g23880-like n=1 Tax=Vicia villosa TaxID=3911 RepID=UPI00273B898F|nr:F-box/kelch-repeat protein At3g23880-like [Vicia villosa]